MEATTPFRAFERLAVDFAAALRRGDKSESRRLLNLMGDRATGCGPRTAARAAAVLRRVVAAAVPAHDLPSAPGVYVITDATHLTDGLGPAESYVGCSKNIRERFLSPVMGHLSDGNRTRSASIVGRGDYRIAVAYLSGEVRTADLIDDLAAAEALWWMVALAGGGQVTNDPSSMGAMSERAGAWIVGAELATGRTVMARGATEMVRVAGAKSLKAGLVVAVASGYQGSAHGWAFRYATPAEVRTADAIGPDAVKFGREKVTWAGKSIQWRGGGLGLESRQRLAQRSRGRYNKKPKLPYRYVTYMPVGADGVQYFGSYYCTTNDSDQRSNTTYVGKKFLTPLAAARAREDFLDANPHLDEFNRRNELPDGGPP